MTSDQELLDAFGNQAWLATELAEKLSMTVEDVRRRMIILENTGRVSHVREGRFNWYYTTKAYEEYLAKHPEERIRRQLRE